LKPGTALGEVFDKVVSHIRAKSEEMVGNLTTTIGTCLEENGFSDKAIIADEERTAE
jgi:nucleosome binding factor SPN SPT16 subunit